jgi:hypothetical protein
MRKYNFFLWAMCNCTECLKSWGTQVKVGRKQKALFRIPETKVDLKTGIRMALDIAPTLYIREYPTHEGYQGSILNVTGPSRTLGCDGKPGTVMALLSTDSLYPDKKIGKASWNRIAKAIRNAANQEGG